MTAWWMGQLALLGVLLAVAAFGAEAALKVARRPTRWVWIAAMGMTLMLGMLASMRRATDTTANAVVHVNTLHMDGEPVAQFQGGLAYWVRTAWYDLTTALSAQVQRAWAAWHTTMPGSIDRELMVAWAVASLLLLIAFVTVHVRYQRRRGQWPLGEVQGTRVRIAGDTGPAVIGVTSAEIVVPKWLLDRDANEQRLVLEHELEHVRQHDPMLLALAQAAVILLPWNPAMWWMASRLRLAVELDCDRRVLRRGATARDYGTLLIDLTGHRAGFGAALPAFSCTPSHLERRLVAMTPKQLKHPIARVLSATAFASLAVLAACEAKLPTAQDVDDMTSVSAVKAAQVMLDTANVIYFVNNAPVSKDSADKIAAERIATVNVSQKGLQSGGQVRLMLRPVGDSATPTRVEFKRMDAGAASDLTGPTKVSFVTTSDSITLTSPSGTATRATVALLVPNAKAQAEASRQKTPFTGLVYVDGVLSDMAAMARIAPDQIATVNIVKGDMAKAQFSDPRAVNGVIQITTKAAKR